MSSLRGLLQTRILVAVCIVLLLGNIGWVVRGQSGRSEDAALRTAQRAYPLLAPRVLRDQQDDILMNFVPLRKQLQAKFDGLQVQKSFYFEYLPDGTSIRVGADEELIAASLIKLPLVMNLYKAAELGRINLDMQVTVTEDELDDAYGDLYKRGAGYHMTLREAARHAISESDNTASRVIFDHMKGRLGYDEQSLARLDVDQNQREGQAVINARAYGSVLKGLYFSSYLEKRHSQELLDFLAASTATNRLTAQLPKGTKVVHKIGVYNAAWSESDCGIVYAPRRPYLICVMVGLPEQEADKFIADVSKEVYDYVIKQ